MRSIVLGMAAGCGLPYVLLLLASLLGQSWGQMICWQAMIACHSEDDCRFAYRQYTEACEGILAGEKVNEPTQRRCPSHCINAIIQLNSTKAGPALEKCNCADDDMCKATKLAIEPCMPRTSGGGAKRGEITGCTEARRMCAKDGRCSLSLSSYMRHCGQVFNGLSCSAECKRVVTEMMAVPKGQLLSDCVCDGIDRPICESVKDSTLRLCFGLDRGQGGPSSSGESDDDFEDEYDDSFRPTKPSSSAAAPTFTLWTCMVLMALPGLI